MINVELANIAAALENIKLAGDKRLEGWSARNDIPGFEALEAEGDSAAVDGCATISFVNGLTKEERDDVLYSTQFAQRAAQYASDQAADAGEPFQKSLRAWYETFDGVMAQLGWVSAGFVFAEEANYLGEFEMDKAALDLVAAVAIGGQLTILRKAIDALKNLNGENRAVRILELRSLASRNGNMQLGAVERSATGALSMALGAFCFTLDDEGGSILGLFKWGAKECSLWTAARQLTLNHEHYALVRKSVIDRLGVSAGDYVAKIPIG